MKQIDQIQAVLKPCRGLCPTYAQSVREKGRNDVLFMT